MLVADSLVKELTIEFADCFSKKDIKGIEALLSDHFSLFAPDVKCVRGKSAALKIFEEQFRETEHVDYKICKLYQDGDTSIMEYKITLDDKVFEGVDFVKWESGKMTLLRSYNNP